jgi:23S rRNA pseudouridine2604 synthase
MTWTKTYDGAEPVRLNKWLAQTGVCSRREADAFIADGLVRVDGERVQDAGRKLEPGQTVALEAAASAELDAQISVVVHKPVGIVSAQPEGDQVPAARLLTRDRLFGPAAQIPGSRASLAPLGRLDQDSRGLLILAEDGVLAKALIGPESQLEKEYVVTVAGDLTVEKLNLLREGLELDGRKLKRARIGRVAPQTFRIGLKEGRNRQIRRMCEQLDLWVTDLIRVRIGPLELGDLPEGRWRPLKPEERAALIAAA